MISQAFIYSYVYCYAAGPQFLHISYIVFHRYRRVKVLALQLSIHWGRGRGQIYRAGASRITPKDEELRFRDSGTRRYKFMTNGKTHQLRDVAQAQLFHYVGTVRLHRLDAQY